MGRKKIRYSIISAAAGIIFASAPVCVPAEDAASVGPGGSIEVDRGDSFEYDTGEGQSTDTENINDDTNTSDETTESGANGSTNQSYVDDRTQDEKDMNKYYVMLRDLVASWRSRCNGTPSYYGIGSGTNNITEIQFGQLDLSDIEEAKSYLDSFLALRDGGDVDGYWSDYYGTFDFRDSSGSYEATAVPDESGADTLTKSETEKVKNAIVKQEGLTGEKNSIPYTNGAGILSEQTYSPFGELSNDNYTLALTVPQYAGGSVIRTDLLPEGLHNSPSNLWYQDIEGLYRFLDSSSDENTTDQGKFHSNAMNDFCSIALLKNYKIQEVIKEEEAIGDPISDDYQIHLFSEDENGNRTEIDVLETNQRLNTISLSDYPDVTKLVAKTYRKFNLTTYTRAAYADYEYLVDVGTNNILWFSEHSMEGSAEGKTGCKTVTIDVKTGTTGWTADPEEAEVIVRDLSELTSDDSTVERVG